MHQENYDLQMESNLDNDRQFSKLISYIFSDQYIFMNKKFRQQVESDRKGYVPIHSLLQNKSVLQYFRQNNIEILEHQIIVIKCVVQQFCFQLHYQDNRIRRLNPWNPNIIKMTKPIIIEEMQQKLEISDIRAYFGDQCLAKRNNRGFVVYSPYLRQILEVIEEKQPPFKIISKYEGYCREKSRWLKLWQTGEQRFYRSLKYRYYPRSQYQFSSAGKNGINQKLWVKSEDQPKCVSFEELVVTPNPLYNSLLEKYIELS